MGAFLVGAGTTGLNSVPLLKVTTALTSSILALRFNGRAYLIHSPRVLLCLGREFPFFRTLLLVR